MNDDQNTTDPAAPVEDTAVETPDMNAGNTAAPVADAPMGDAPTDAPVADAPADDSAAAPVEEKCSTCGGPATAGNCAHCGQNQMGCTCPPSETAPAA